MANETLKKITTRAKLLRIKSPGMKYTNAVKEASRQLKREGKIGLVKKTPKAKIKKAGTLVKAPIKKATRARDSAPKKRTVTKFSSRKEVIGSHNIYRVRDDIERAIKDYTNHKKEVREKREKGYQTKIKLIDRKLLILKKQLNEQNKLIRLLIQ